MVKIIVIIRPAPWLDILILAMVQVITHGDTRKMGHENKRNRGILFRMKRYIILKKERIINIIYASLLVKAF